LVKYKLLFVELGKKTFSEGMRAGEKRALNAYGCWLNPPQITIFLGHLPSFDHFQNPDWLMK
jgi:hypothetical protein